MSLLLSATCMRCLIAEVSLEPLLGSIGPPVIIRHRTLFTEYINKPLTSMTAPFNPTFDEI